MSRNTSKKKLPDSTAVAERVQPRALSGEAVRELSNEGLQLLRFWNEVLVDEMFCIGDRVPFNSGVLAFKNGAQALELINELFRIARFPQLLGGVWRVPRNSGWWEQDAFAAYVRQHGLQKFVTLKHRTVQSFVRPTKSAWQPGDFAAHFTFLRATGGPDEQVAFVREGLENITRMLE